MDRLTIATLNVRNRQDRWSKRREYLVAELTNSAPDLISLQEVSIPIGQGYWIRNQINLRLSGSPDRPYRLLQRRFRHLSNWTQGIAILSRRPVLAHDAINLGYGGRLALRANIDLADGQTLDFVAVHLQAGVFQREARLEQTMRLMGWLDEVGPVPARIIAGDFNETPDGPAIQQMKQAYRSAFASFVGHEPLATFPTALSQRPNDWSGCLDYIFVSRAVTAVENAALFATQPAPNDHTLFPSDHVGVMAVVRLDPDAVRPKLPLRVQ